MAKEVEKEAKEVKNEAANEARKSDTKWVHGPVIQKEWLHVGEDKARLDIPVGKDKEGKTMTDKYFVPKSWVVEGKEGPHIRRPETVRHDAIQVQRAGSDKSVNLKDPKELENASRRIKVQKPQLTPKKEPKAAEKGKENEGR